MPSRPRFGGVLIWKAIQNISDPSKDAIRRLAATFDLELAMLRCARRTRSGRALADMYSKMRAREVLTVRLGPNPVQSTAV
jgi:hypothetical protein